MATWDEKELDVILGILRKHEVAEYQTALKKISQKLKRDVNKDILFSLFRRRNLSSPTSYCKAGEDADTENTAENVTVSDAHRKLHDLVKRKPMKFSELCDKLDLSPSKTHSLIKEAKELGYKIHVEHDHIGVTSEGPNKHVINLDIAPVVGERQKVAVISDLHLGSKYCLREQLIEFVNNAYSQGVREILVPGDVLDGAYRHGMWEVSHSGIDAQVRDLFDTLPCLPGLTYHGITGNHGETFTEKIGIGVGSFITKYFRDEGRNDLKFYGNRGAFLKIRGATIHLWHPRSGVAYARSYGIQKQIEKYTVVKPQILLVGHWHIYCHVYERGIHGIACPTFQGGGSSFGKSLGGSPAIGGLILSWGLTKDGTMRELMIDTRFYFELEKPIEIENSVDGKVIKR